MATDARETKRDAHLEVTVSEGPEKRRQGKFQPFRRLFGKRKKREAERGFDAAELKASFSTGEVCNGVVSDDEETNQHLRELNPIGSRALSHDSVFIPEEPVKESDPEQTMSQENVSDKVRNLQRQIAQGIKFGQKPPSLRKSEDDDGSSDEEDVPRSPLKVLAQVEAEPVETEEPKGLGISQAHATQQGETGTHSTPVKSPRSKRILPAMEGTIESINLDAVPQSVPRLDNTAAKHKLSVKPKNQRISRKHRRFTQDLQEVSLPGILQEETDTNRDLEAVGVSADEEHLYESPEKAKKQKFHDEERRESRKRRELEEQKHREEAQEEERKRRAEELRMREMEEERCRKQQQQEEEERRQREEAERRMEEERRIREEEEEEKRQREEEEKRIRMEEEKLQREEEQRRVLEEEERRQREEEKRREEEERRRKEDEERRHRELEAERVRLEEEKKLREAEEEEWKKKQELEEKTKQEAEEKKRREEEEQRITADEPDGSSDPVERKRRAEEVRWREMEERQRPFSFKVSSGEKQILFQKVNLTPVTPASSQQGGGAAADLREGTKASSTPGGADSTLLSSQYVPHTAILVTGAQLCGTAVNMDQIRDTACKSLLGLGEDWKAMGTPPPSKMSPERKSGKTKSLSESSSSTDQSSAAILAEWASIRSKIFKGAEEGKYEDYTDPGVRGQSRPSSDDPNQTSFPHTNLRKTMSASAKFSITPARKKFADSSNRNSELMSPEDKEGGKTAPTDTPAPQLSSASMASAGKAHQSRGGKTVRISDGSEGCMFAKDLPSFLVPSPSQGSTKSGSEEGTEVGSLGGESEDSDWKEEGEGQERGQGSEDKPSPFGIKLRRTNYSLRFHGEQSTEKRKKRYSAGDSFDGVPSPLTPMDPDSDSASVFSDRSSPASPLRENDTPGANKPMHASAGSASEPRVRGGKTPTAPAATHSSESDKVPSKPSLYQRPTVSPNPSAASTPPPSPLPKVDRRGPGELLVQRKVGPDSHGGHEDERGDRRKSSTSAVAQLHRNGQGQGEEEPKEKRCFFPSISIPWREKTDRKTEIIRKEKPSLQSRHSLDSSRVGQDKETGPLWITMALQKQKGFREQQQTRDDRRSQREAKLAEKQGVLTSPSEGKGNGNSGHLKPEKKTEEPKRPDSLLARFDRRDHLKKANTLPSSVTVEIADSTPSPPAVKEVTKRFPSSDSPQVSTEPAWLALAKRKAKAWSDCPQIIK